MAKEKKMVKVKLDLDRLNDTDHVMVGVGGKILKVPRGVEVEIPAAYAEVLAHSGKAEIEFIDYINKKHKEEKNSKNTIAE